MRSRALESSGGRVGAYELRAENDAVFRVDDSPPPRTDAELVRAAQRRSIDTEQRRRVAELLLPHWERAELPPSSLEHAKLVARDPHVALVIAGQQPALAGGTLLHFAKIISAAELANRLRAGGVPAVPVLWVADEDHDVGELFSGWVPRGERFATIDNPFPRGRTKISALRCEPEQVIEEVRALGLDASPFFRALVSTASASPAEWFRRFVHAVLPDDGLLPLHADWLRPLQSEGFAREIQTPGRLRNEVDRANAALRSRGLEPPITEASDVPLFWVDDTDRRHRLDGSGDTNPRFTIRGGPIEGYPAEGLTESALLELAREEPQRFSPDALLRPLLQDALLEPFAVVTGPTEMTYQLELVEAYEARGIARPIPFHRLRPRLLDSDEVDGLERDGLRVEDVTAEADPAALAPSPEAAALVGELRRLGGDLVDWAESVAAGKNVSVPEPSAPLAKRVDRLARRWKSDLDKLHGAIEREVTGSAAERRGRIESVGRSSWVRGAAAERVVSFLEFARRFGPDLPALLRSAYDPYDEREQLIAIDSERVSVRSNDFARDDSGNDGIETDEGER